MTLPRQLRFGYCIIAVLLMIRASSQSTGDLWVILALLAVLSINMAIITDNNNDND